MFSRLINTPTSVQTDLSKTSRLEGGTLRALLPSFLFPSFLSLSIALVCALSLTACAPRRPVCEHIPEFSASIASLHSIPFKRPVGCRECNSADLELHIRDSVLKAEGALHTAEVAPGSKSWKSVFTLLGIISPGTHRGHPLLSEPAGYYDPLTQSIIIKEGLGRGDSLMTAAHELVHAWQDQIFSLTQFSSGVSSYDERSARRALLEGHAVLVSQNLVEREGCSSATTGAFLSKLQHRIDRYSGPARGKFLALLSDLPYSAGLRFTCALYTAGGIPRVVDALRAPPSTTMEVLFPEPRQSDSVPLHTPTCPTVPPAMASDISSKHGLADSEEALGGFFILSFLGVTQQLSVAFPLVEQLCEERVYISDDKRVMLWRWQFQDAEPAQRAAQYAYESVHALLEGCEERRCRIATTVDASTMELSIELL